MGWTDVHCHLNMLECTPQEALAQAEASGVTRLFTIGTQPADHGLVLGLAKQFYPKVVCTLGIHPHDAQTHSPESLNNLRLWSAEKEVVGIGEIGLDYYYNNSPKEVQLKAFEEQLALAVDLGMPVEIHTRDAEPDTVSILTKFGGKVQGLLHCFTGTQWLADEALALGLNISFSGIITFKNADSLREVVRQTPLDRLHVETDAPFLAPVPQRGKKNRPSFVVHTAELVAELKGIPLSDLQKATDANMHALFPKVPKLE